MAVYVQRRPVSGKVYRAFATAQLVSLVVGVPLIVVVAIMTATGNGSGPVMNVLLYWLLLPTFLVFIFSNSACKTYYDRDER